MGEKEACVAAQSTHPPKFSFQGDRFLTMWPRNELSQVSLVLLGVAFYWTDVGTDAEGVLRWLSMSNCYRYHVIDDPDV